MKNIHLILILFLSSLSANSQEIIGSWFGALDVQGTELKVVFHISEIEGILSCKMDSPAQGAFGIPMDYITFLEDEVKTGVKAQLLEYAGKLDAGVISGTFSQGGMQLPLVLSTEEKRKPQEPKKPYPYESLDVKFDNETEGITLAGTLSVPSGNGQFAAVILVSGSGPQNRDEELLGHKPFLVLSDYLTRNGIAVLRYDDRGVGESGGKFTGSTSEDFKNDALSAVQYLSTLKNIDSKKIGIIGHSEGGLIAPMVAAENKSVSFIVLLAGPGIDGETILLKQAELIGRSEGGEEGILAKNNTISKTAFEMVKSEKNDEKLQEKLTAYLTNEFEKDPSLGLPEGMEVETFVEGQVRQMTDPWFKYFLSYDPAPSLSEVKCPVLALNGEFDLQVPPKENLAAIKSALNKGGNMDVVALELKDLNHLFQTTATGAPSEYALLEETFSPKALSLISEWIKGKTK